MEYYRKALEDPLRSAFGYLVILSVVFGIITGTLMGLQSHSEFTLLADALDSGEIPYFNLTGGHLEIDIDEPVVIDQQYQIFIIDTTDSYSLNDLAGYDIGYLVTPERVIVSSRGTDPRAINFSDFESVSFDSRDLSTLLNTLDIAIIFVVLLFTLIAGLISLLFSTFIAAVAFNVIRIIARLPMHFPDIYKIVLFSYAPAVLWQQVTHFIPWAPPVIIHYFFVYGFSMIILSKLTARLLKENREQE